MILPSKVIHPTGEPEFTPKKSEISALIADTFNGKIHIEWDPQAQVTTLGQLAFFIQYLKVGHRFILKTAVEYIPANKNQHMLDKKN